jgi:hypothetical protein
MTALERRVCKLEARTGLTVPEPWELPGWEALSADQQTEAIEEYVRQAPHTRFAHLWRAIPTMSDAELEDIIRQAEEYQQTLAQAQASGTPQAPRP